MLAELHCGHPADSQLLPGSSDGTVGSNPPPAASQMPSVSFDNTLN